MFRKLVPLVIVSLCGVVILPLPQQANASTPLTRAVVKKLHNWVQLLPQNRPKRRARRSDTMAPGDGLATGRASLADLRFNDGSLARIGERAVFRFVPSTRTFRLLNGTVLLLIPPGQGQTKIRTRSAGATIRGSALFVRYDEQTDTTVVGSLTDSGIEVFNKDESRSQVLKAGQLIVVVKGKIQGLYDFDLRSFYETSDLVRGLDLSSPSDTSSDPAIASVQAETSEAVSKQVPIKGEDVVKNPSFIELSPVSSETPGEEVVQTLPKIPFVEDRPVIINNSEENEDKPSLPATPVIPATTTPTDTGKPTTPTIPATTTPTDTGKPATPTPTDTGKPTTPTIPATPTPTDTGKPTTPTIPATPTPTDTGKPTTPTIPATPTPTDTGKPTTPTIPATTTPTDTGRPTTPTIPATPTPTDTGKPTTPTIPATPTPTDTGKPTTPTIPATPTPTDTGKPTTPTIPATPTPTDTGKPTTPQTPTPNPEPQTPTPNPEPQTPMPNPEPQTPMPNPEPQTPMPNPEPQTPTPNPEPQTPMPNPEPQTPMPNPEPQTPMPNPEPQTPMPNPEPQTPMPNPEPQTPMPNPEPQTPMPNPGSGGMEPTPKPEPPAVEPPPIST